MRFHSEHREHLKNLSPMMRFVLDHRAQPLPNSDTNSCRCHALFLEILICQRPENLDRLSVEAVHERDYILTTWR